MNWTSTALPEISIDDMGLGDYIVKIKNLPDRDIIELNKRVLDLFKPGSKHEIVVEPDFDRGNTISIRVITPDEEVLKELGFVLESFFREQIKAVQMERETYLREASLMFQSQEVYIPTKENPNVVYLPLDCPGCGRRRLLYNRFRVRVDCEKCGRTGDQLDEMTTKRLGG